MVVPFGRRMAVSTPHMVVELHYCIIVASDRRRIVEKGSALLYIGSHYMGRKETVASV
jgi:hypothetical protein